MELPDEPTPGRNDDSKPAFGKNDVDSKVNRFGAGGDDVDHAKKSRKSKGEKLAKFWKSSKSEKFKSEKSKKPSKSGNLSKFDAIEAGPSFLTPGA